MLQPDLPQRALSALAELLTPRTMIAVLITLNDEGDLELVHLSDCNASEQEIAKLIRAAARMATDPRCTVERVDTAVM